MTNKSKYEEMSCRLIAGLLMTALGYLAGQPLMRFLCRIILCLFSVAKLAVAIFLIASILLFLCGVIYGPIPSATATTKDIIKEQVVQPAPTPKFEIGDPRRYGGISSDESVPSAAYSNPTASIGKASISSTESVSSQDSDNANCASIFDSESQPSTAPTSLLLSPLNKPSGKSLFVPVNALAVALVEAAAAKHRQQAPAFSETSCFSPAEFAAILAVTPKPSTDGLTKKRVHGLENPLTTYHNAPIFRECDLQLMDRLKSQFKFSQLSNDDRLVDALPGRQSADTRSESRQQRRKRLRAMLNLSRYAPLQECRKCDGTGINSNGFSCHECLSFFNNCDCDVCMCARHPAQFMPRRCSEWDLNAQLRCNRPLSTNSENYCSHHAVPS